MKIIGLNSNYDSPMNKIYSGSCALIIDGEIRLAFAEERISRIKHEGGFKRSLKYILDSEKLTLDDIDRIYISFYANPLIPDKEMIALHLKELGIEKTPEKLVVMPSHHLSHACLSYFLSDFEEAVIMVADNEGNLLFPKDARQKGGANNYCERNSYFWARGNCIALIGRDFEEPGSVCFGKAYNKFNKFIGFGSYLNVGKTMGLSSYGHIPEAWRNIDLWGMEANGKLYSNIKDTLDDFADIKSFFGDNGIKVDRIAEERAYNTQDYKNLAFFVQEQLNKWAVKKMDFLKRTSGISNICVSGGVGLNGIMNRELEKQLDCEVFVAPYCSDPGQALGNAIYGFIQQSGKGNNSSISRVKFKNFVYLGKNYTDAGILEKVRENYRNDNRISFTVIDEKELNAKAAQMLVNGKIVGWFQGKSEYGARALGNRSILADPRSVKIRDRVNTLKGRELFRPLAPSVLAEHTGKFFLEKGSKLDLYMLRVVAVKKEQIDKIAGVAHVDHTSRIQSVTKEINPRYYGLINEFYRLTGIPMIINTSFNKAGEPIVESPADAVEAFLNMDLDALICGNVLIERKR